MPVPKDLCPHYILATETVASLGATATELGGRQEESFYCQNQEPNHDQHLTLFNSAPFIWSEGGSPSAKKDEEPPE